MARRPSTFKQNDLTRAVKALMKAGLPVQRAEIDPLGKIAVFAGAPQDGEATPVINEWDDVK